MFSDPRTEWRIADVERKAGRAESRLHELDSLRSDVARLERSNGELGSEVARLRDEFTQPLGWVEQTQGLIATLCQGENP